MDGAKSKSLLALTAGVSALINRSLAHLRQFTRLRDVLGRPVALKHAIQEPDNKAVRQQNEHSD